jgi:hypothetical protein
LRIEFQAYADDYTLQGEVELEGARLSDFLDGAGDIELQRVTLRALDDGREHHLDSAVVQREELCVVVASGPRGSPDRRLRTRPYPMRAEVGPYQVIGYFHTVPTADPLRTAVRRRIVALSPATIEFSVAGERVTESQDALLLVGSKLTVFESASDQELGLAKDVTLPTKVDPGAKDLTGEVRLGRPDQQG